MRKAQSRIITPEELSAIRYPLPESWKKVAGILKGKRRIDPLRYQRQIRAEWEKRIACTLPMR